MPIAITRRISPSLARCELTHLSRELIDLERARAQHASYEDCLRSLGCTVLTLPPDPDLPDCVFVEDTAVVVDELAVITRPGAPSRRRETEAVAAALGGHRELAFITEPATLDGGDVLRIGRRIFVGLSSRTNAEGAAQLEERLSPHGYTVETLTVGGCLHLKSAATEAAPGTVLLNPSWVDAAAFTDFRVVAVDPSEPGAANGLLVGETTLFPSAYPRTAARLEEAGARLVRVDVSELAKAEGAVTCCSLILNQP